MQQAVMHVNDMGVERLQKLRGPFICREIHAKQEQERIGAVY